MNKKEIRVFLCEDDESLGLMLQEYLIAKDYEVDLFTDGETGLEAFGKEEYALCLIDVMMPKMDGFELAKQIRAAKPNIPIIFVTAKDQKKDVLRGFKLGADDYITKPFSMQELEARISAIMRRIIGEEHEEQQFYQLGKLLYDTKKQTLTTEDGKVLTLTTKENELLTLFCVYANETLERDYALKTIWADANYFNARSMDVYVTKLRKILQADPSLEIKNVHGKGYRLVTPMKEIPQDQIKKI